MNSFSKNKFLILGFVCAAVLLVPANTSFADHPTVSIGAVEESGFSQTCAVSQGGDGCYTPVTATVDVGGVVTMTNSDPTGVHTFTSGTVNGFTPQPDNIFDSGVLMSGDSFEWSPTEAGTYPYYCMLHTWMIGEIIVQEVEVESDVDQLTIDSFTIFSQDDHTKFSVQGNVIGSSTTHNLTYLITDSNGNVVYDYPSYTQPNGDRFGLEGPVFWNVTSYGTDGITPSTGEYTPEYNGNFTLKICASDHGICIEEAFTINSIVEDTAADTTPPVVSVPNDLIFQSTETWTDLEGEWTTATNPSGFIGLANFPPTATDDVDVDLNVQCLGVSSIRGNFFQWHADDFEGEKWYLGTNTITCTATDSSGNTGSASFTITVIEDTGNVQASSPRGAITEPISLSVGGGAVYLDVDDDGNIFVGLDNGVIKKYDTNNNLEFSLTPGDVRGIAVDDSGNIFVGQLGSAIPGTNTLYYGKITKYSSTGNHIGEFATLPGVPFRMAIDSNDNLYTTSDSFDERLIKVTPSGTVATLKTWTYATTGSNPDLKGIDVDSSGKIYVGQNDPNLNNQCCLVMKYSSSGNVIGSIGQSGTGNYPERPLGTFAEIQDVAIDSSGNIYVSDSYNNRITVFDPSGNLIRWFAVGNPSGGGNGVYGVDIDGAGNIYTAERNDSRVQIFPPNYSEPVSNDSTPPTITQISNIERYTAYSSGSAVSWNLASQDNELVASQECDHTSGSIFPIGTTTVTCTAIDNAGNESTMSFDITQIFSEITSNTITSDKDSYVFGIDQKAIITGTVLNMDSGFVWVESYAPDGSGGGGQVEVYGGHFSTERWLNNNYYEQHTVKLKTVGSCYPNCTVLDTVSFTVTQPSEDEINDNVDLYKTSFIQTVNESGFSQSCVETGCYTPSTLTVDVGDLINMTNTDPTGVHTFTSGTVDGFTPNPSGTFDSGVLMSGDTFAWTPQTDVDQPYYCMLHTWMVGTIVVGDVDVAEPAVDNSVTTTGSNGFTIEYTDTQYRITQFENDHLYGWSLTFDGNPSSSGTHRVDDSNTNKWYDHSSDGRTGDLVKTWYYDVAQTIPLATVSWTVESASVPEPTPSDDHTITTVNESGFSQSCVDTGCYTPSTLTVYAREPITMTNTDPTAVHTFTSGTVDEFAPSPDDNFHSGILSSGDSYTWTPRDGGNYPYYCMLHTWMVGEIIVLEELEVLEPTTVLPNPTIGDLKWSENTYSQSEQGDVMLIDPDRNWDSELIDIFEIQVWSDSDPTKIPILVVETGIDTGIFTSGTDIYFTNVPSFYDEEYSDIAIQVAEGDTITVEYVDQILPDPYTTSDILEIKATAIITDVVSTPEQNVDNTPPTLTQNQNITVNATASNGAVVNYELPQVTDDNSGVDLGPTCIPAPGSFFQTGITEVTCSASDWAGNVGTTSFTVTVQPQIIAPVEIITDVTLEIGQSQYTTDDSIFVTGFASPFTENNVSIQVEDPLENIVLVEQITPESSGVYTGIISPNFLWNTSGNYTMSATYGNSTSNTSFEFEFVEPVIDELISATGITLQTDASQYFIGEIITIESALTDIGSGNEIGIFVTDPNGTLRIVQLLNTDDSGSVILSVKAQDDWVAGEYEIYASDSDLEKKVTIDIVKPLPEISLSPTVTTTENGNAITSYDAGDMAYFATSLLSEYTSDVLVTINVVDADDTTLGVAFFKSIVGKGDSELVLGFKIPEDAADGAAKIYVNTYTDWIDQGGVVIGSELLSEVNINGVIIEEPVIEEPVIEEPVLPENAIPRLSLISDIVQPASFTTGSIVSYSLPIATSELTILSPTCTPAPGSLFPIGSTQVTCTATNAVGNTGMTSFMITINPIAQVTDQTLTVKVGKDSYNNLEPIFVTGSVGKVTGDPVNLEVRNTQNDLISIEQVSPKESGVYNVILISNELWNSSGEYRVIANYGDVIALDEFAFELEEVEEIIPEKIPTSLVIDTLDSAYVLGDVVAIGVNLVDAGAGEPILLEIRDSNNDQVLLQSLNTDNDGVAVFFYQLDSTGASGVYSVTATSDEWNFSNSQNLVVVPQIPDITIGDVVSTLQDGTVVDSFESGNMGYFQTPVISESVSDILITVNIFDVENTPLGLAHFNSKVVDDTFDIVLGLQIPQEATPGLATVYINTYTDWPNEGGVPILQEQVSFIEISPASTTSLTISSEEPLEIPAPFVDQSEDPQSYVDRYNNEESYKEWFDDNFSQYSSIYEAVGLEKPENIPELVPVYTNISVQTESTSYTTGNSIVISGTVENLAEYEQPVIIMIVSPDGNLVSIDQIVVDSSGNYSTTVNAGGTMNSNGDYEVRAQYGPHKITTVFDFTRN